MKLLVDFENNILISNVGNRQPLTLLQCKRTPTRTFAVNFFSGLNQIEIDPCATSPASLQFGVKIHDDFAGALEIYTSGFTKTGGSWFTDGTTTNASAIVTSLTAGFSSADVGLSISGAGIPANTTILSVQSSTRITLSTNATATASGVTITIGRVNSPATYTASAAMATVGINDLFIIGGISRTPANQAARYALTGLSNGTIVRQVDTQAYWIVVDSANLANANGWSSDVPEKEYIELDAELTWQVGTVIDVTFTFTLRIWNNVIQSGGPVPVPAISFSSAQYVTTVPASNTDFSMFPGGVAPTTGFYLAPSLTKLWVFSGGWSAWIDIAIPEVVLQVATNTDKLALTGLVALQNVALITGEGNRVEMYIGGVATDDSNWAILSPGYAFADANDRRAVLGGSALDNSPLASMALDGGTAPSNNPFATTIINGGSAAHP